MTTAGFLLQAQEVSGEITAQHLMLEREEKIHFENEIRFETILFSHLKEKVIKALLEVHPYEEVAYDIYALENEYAEAGLGIIGNFTVKKKVKKIF